MTPRGRTIRTTIIVAASIIVGVPVVGIVIIMALLGQFRDNVAADTAGPIGHSVEALAGHRVCDSGDAGYSPDNTQPWYQGYYEVKDSDSLAATLTADVAKQGYTLVNQPKLEGSHAPSQLLRARKSGRVIDINIYRGRDATTDCDSTTTHPAAQGNAVILIAVTYPDRDAG
jgi:hypothetical protein